MSEIAEAIIKIVKSDREIGAALDIAKDPPKIYSRRGMAYINSSGGITSSGGAESSTVGAPGAEEDADPENSEVGAEQNSPGSSNGGASGGPAGETGDIDDLLNDTTGTANTLGSQIARITGTDPATGTGISIDLNRPCGAEYDAPDGWEDPDTPPLVEDWEEGKYFEATGTGAWASWTPFAGVTQHVSEDSLFNEAQALIGESWPYGQGTITMTGMEKGPSHLTTQWLYVSYYYEWNNGNNWVNYNNKDFCSYVRAGLSCTPGGSAYCPTSANPPAYEDVHPSDGVCNIAYDCSEGGFKGHALDPDCAADQIVPSGCKYISSGSDPSKHYRACKLGDGGNKITPVDAPVFDGNGDLISGGAPTPGGITRTTDANGRINGFYGSAESLHVN